MNWKKLINYVKILQMIYNKKDKILKLNLIEIQLNRMKIEIKKWWIKMERKLI